MMDDTSKLIWRRRSENAFMLLVLSPQLLLALIGWLLHLLWFIPLAIIGVLIAVPLAVTFRQVQTSPIGTGVIVTAPRWLSLWGNDEDGFASAEAVKHYKLGWPQWLNMYWWAAIRNPVGNLRFIKQLYPPPVAHRIRFLQAESWALTWQGLLYHFAWLGTKRVFAFGFKYYPTDARRDADYGWRKYGCGFAIRLRARSPEDTAADI